MADQIDPDSIHLGGISPEYYANYSAPPPIEPGSLCELPPANSLTIPSISLLPIVQSCVLSFPSPVPEIFVPAVPPPSGCEVLLVEAPDITTCPITQDSFLVLTSAGPAESDQGVQECKLKLSGLICAKVPCPDGTKVEMDVTFGGAASEKSYFNIEDAECSSKSTLHIEIPPPCESNASTFDIKLSGAISGSFSDPTTTECGAPPDCGCNYKGFLHVDPACNTFTGSAEKVKFTGNSIKNSTLAVQARGVPECGFDLVGDIQVNACDAMNLRVVTVDNRSLLKSAFTGETFGALDLELQSSVIPADDPCTSILKLTLGGGTGGGGGGGKDQAGVIGACPTTTITPQIAGQNVVRNFDSNGNLVSSAPLISDITIENDCSPKVIIVEMLQSKTVVKYAKTGYIVRVHPDASVSISQNPKVNEASIRTATGQSIPEDMAQEIASVLVLQGSNSDLVYPGQTVITKIDAVYVIKDNPDDGVIFLLKHATGAWDDEGVAGNGSLAVLKTATAGSLELCTAIEISQEQSPQNAHKGVRILKETALGYTQLDTAMPPAIAVVTEVEVRLLIIPLTPSCSPCQQVLSITMNPVDIYSGGGGTDTAGNNTPGNNTPTTNKTIKYVCSELGYSAKAHEDLAEKLADTVGAGEGNQKAEQIRKIMEEYNIFKEVPTSTSLSGGTGAQFSKIDRVVFDKNTAFDKANLSKGFNRNLSGGFVPLSAGTARRVVDSRAVLSMKNDLANKQGAFANAQFVGEIENSGALKDITDQIENADNAVYETEVITHMELNWLNTNLVAAPTCTECCTGSSSYLELCGKSGGMLYLDNLAFNPGDSPSSNTITTTSIDINKDNNRVLIGVEDNGYARITISSKNEEGDNTAIVMEPEFLSINNTIYLIGAADEEELRMGGRFGKNGIEFSCKSGKAPLTIQNPSLFPDGPGEFEFNIKEIVICDEQGKSKKAYVLMAIP